MSKATPLTHSDVATRLPVRDLARARAFYSGKLGLESVDERPGGLLYRCRHGSFALFVSAGAPSGDHTQMAWEVAVLRATVAALRARGVEFLEYDLPGFTTVDGIPGLSWYPIVNPVGEAGCRRLRQVISAG